MSKQPKAKKKVASPTVKYLQAQISSVNSQINEANFKISQLTAAKLYFEQALETELVTPTEEK